MTDLESGEKTRPHTSKDERIEGTERLPSKVGREVGEDEDLEARWARLAERVRKREEVEERLRRVGERFEKKERELREARERAEKQAESLTERGESTAASGETPERPCIRSKGDLDRAIEYHPEVRLRQNLERDCGDAVDQDSPYRLESHMLSEAGIKSETDLLKTLGHHPEVRLRRDFDSVYACAVEYLRTGSDYAGKGEALVRGLDQLELRGIYESVKGGPPEVRIESMEDFTTLAERYRGLSNEETWLCGKYFELKDVCSTNQTELARVHGVSENHIALWSLGMEPVPIRDVRRAEEDRMISEWAAKTDSRDVRKQIEADPELDSVRRPLRELPLLSRPDVENLCSAYSPKDFSTRDAASVIRAIGAKMGDTCPRVFCADLGNESVPVESPLGTFHTVIRRDRELVEKILEGTPLSDGSVSRMRLALVDDKLYIWKPDTDPMSLVNAYGKLYFHFKDNNSFARLMEDTKTTVDGKRTGGLSDTVEFSERLVREMFGDDLFPRHAANIYAHVRGEHLHLLLDLLGRPLESLEGEISRVTALNGHGGIASIRFPRGEELENAVAALIGTVTTDCHLRENGAVTLAEAEFKRIQAFERSLQAFGDIGLTAKWVPVDNCYKVNLSSVLGEILLHLGLPSGDRTVQNPGFPEAVFRFSWRAKCVLVENIVPHDGTVAESAISWTHSNVLHPGPKGEKYGVRPVVDDGDIAFIKEHGIEYEESWALETSDIKDLRESPKPDVASTASALYDKVYNNPNRLIADGQKVTDSIGVEMKVTPRTVHYFKKTGRVTVAWEIRTARVQEAVKLAIIAPPDDVKKRDAARRILARNPEHVKDALKWFADRGVNMEPWWTGE